MTIVDVSVADPQNVLLGATAEAAVATVDTVGAVGAMGAVGMVEVEEVVVGVGGARPPVLPAAGTSAVSGSSSPMTAATICFATSAPSKTAMPSKRVHA